MAGDRYIRRERKWMGCRPPRSPRFTCGNARSSEGQRSSQTAALAVSPSCSTQHTEQRQRLVSQRLNIENSNADLDLR